MSNNEVKTKKNIRRENILKSPKQNGSSDIDSIPYLEELGVSIIDETQSIQFKDNVKNIIHRWTPYIQGFSSSFVQNIFNQYKFDYEKPSVLEPFAGSGTVVVQARKNGFYSVGNEINPWMARIGKTKINADKINTDLLSDFLLKLDLGKMVDPPSFLKNEKHFREDILEDLRRLKYCLENHSIPLEEVYTIDALIVAFSSIIVPVSNLTRAPSLGYKKNKKLWNGMVEELFRKKVIEIIEDVKEVKKRNLFNLDESNIYLSSSESFNYENKFDLVITSPPYMNGMDYAINYKIEMGWLDFVESHSELKEIKNSMVVCDNVSKKLIRDFSIKEDKYTNDWIVRIKNKIQENIVLRGKYRRMDMADIVHKYFDDMYKIMKNVTNSINIGGRFILVVGDSLIVDEYVPTDLILAKIGVELGMRIESIVKARERRSGQIRSYKLRESIITLVK